MALRGENTDWVMQRADSNHGRLGPSLQIGTGGVEEVREFWEISSVKFASSCKYDQETLEVMAATINPTLENVAVKKYQE